MAAFNKLGSLLRQSALTSRASTASAPALFNAARYMSSKLFVGGLSWGTDDCKLRDAFSGFGEVTEARVITDRETGRSRGFGFVNFAEEEAAKAAVTGMDGQELEGRSVRVNFANERERPAGGGGYGGGGGGYGGGRGGGGGGYGGGGYGGGGGDRGFGGGQESY
ncbi:glycine-rich RNA-binding protein 2, mitochondrial-like [Lolium rigidum]|uniref:glycine-rich RNA-binding protein 2, mitochondrial-like n=1 Tax=Lolium rigidum TaxID=89674 RepID=UPI001F5CE8EE|nr:glycine-rich RNA-binding protein 2, mitochondrial-like [Lolium rigidum]